MITIHDVRGAPVAGLRLARAAKLQAPRLQASGLRASGFRALLDQMTPAAGTAATAPTRFARRAMLRSSAVAAPAAARVDGVPGLRGAARERLADAIRTAADDAGVDPALSLAVARAESNLDPTARSSDGLSVGTFQVTHETKAEMKRKIAQGIVERPQGTDDVALGVGYLRYLHDLFDRDAPLTPGLHTVRVDDPAERRRFAVAAFNAGEGRVAQAQARVAAAGGDPTEYAAIRPLLPRITRGYVERVIGYTAEAERPGARS
jgi:soluble lytic murein transglycosylase-like protein